MGYCGTCGSFMKKIGHNFIDEKGRYTKYVCESCGKLVKERTEDKFGRNFDGHEDVDAHVKA